MVQISFIFFKIFFLFCCLDIVYLSDLNRVPEEARAHITKSGRAIEMLVIDALFLTRTYPSHMSKCYKMFILFLFVVVIICCFVCFVFVFVFVFLFVFFLCVRFYLQWGTCTYHKIIHYIVILILLLLLFNVLCNNTHLIRVPQQWPLLCLSHVQDSTHFTWRFVFFVFLFFLLLKVVCLLMIIDWYWSFPFIDVPEALDEIRRLRPKKAFFVGMSHDIEYTSMNATLKEKVRGKYVLNNKYIMKHIICIYNILTYCTTLMWLA